MPVWTTIPAKIYNMTQKPLKLVNGLLPTLTPSNHRLINTANLLYPCMLVSPLPCMMLFARFGSPLQWYASHPRTATRYAPVMVLFTAARDSKDTDHSCSHHTSCPKGCPCVYTCNTQYSPCAAQRIRSCSYSTKAPDTGDVTVLQPMRGDP